MILQIVLLCISTALFLASMRTLAMSRVNFDQAQDLLEIIHDRAAELRTLEEANVEIERLTAIVDGGCGTCAEFTSGADLEGGGFR